MFTAIIIAFEILCFSFTSLMRQRESSKRHLKNNSVRWVYPKINFKLAVPIKARSI
jgi:hypothetical protein